MSSLALGFDSKGELSLPCDQRAGELSLQDKKILKLLDRDDLINLSRVNKACHKEYARLIEYGRVVVFKKALAFICDQHREGLSSCDKKVLELFQWNDLINLSLVNKACHKKYAALIKMREPKVESFIDLRRFSVLQKCLANNFKNSTYTRCAANLVSSVYETRQRGIKDVKYGAAFPVCPELLHYAMFLAKDQTVLEIAGASGENAALLAFSQAKRVFMNDIVPEEVRAFKNLCDGLPLEVKKKLESVLGNCFDLLQLNPELEGQVGLLLCNNLLHFFNDQEMDAFLCLLKKLLTRGGHAIFTANAIYALPGGKELCEQYPENTAWNSANCLLQDYMQGGTPVDTIFRSVVPSSSREVSVNYKQFYLWLKDYQTDFKWKEDRAGYQAVPKSVAEDLERAVAKQFKKIKENLLMGSIRLVTNEIRFFQEKNFAALFENAGFLVKKTFLISGNGHLYHGDDPYSHAIRVGVVIKAP